jgi:hypothetical protein
MMVGYFFPLLVATGCAVWLLRIKDRSNADFSVFDMIGAIVASFGLMGLTEIGVALYAHDQNMAVVGAIFILVTFQLSFFVAEMGARLGALGMDVLEGGVGIGKTFATALMTMDMKGALKEASKHPVNISDQEKYVGYVREARKFGQHVLYPSLLLTILLPLPYVFTLNVITGVALFLSREYLESKWIDTVERQKLRARMLEMLTIVLIGLNVLKVLWPHLGDILDYFPEARGVTNWAMSFLYSLYSVLSIWWMLGGLVFAVAMSALLDPGEGEGVFHKVRSLMAASMVVVQYLCIVLILFAVFVKAHDKSSLASLKQASVMVDTMTTPTAQVVTTKTKVENKEVEVPAVAISWKDFSQAEKYTVERSDPGSKQFVPLALLQDIVQGTEMAVDHGALKPGEKYVYRLVAKLPHGELKPSDPVRVLIPMPPPPPEPTTVAAAHPEAGVATAATVPAPAHEETDTNPYLDAYCKRHPAACTNM